MSKTGSCLCGKVSYSITGDLRPVVNCHCIQCRKGTGHHVAASRVDDDQLTIVDANKVLRWFRASDEASRGFCGNCGSPLFWKGDGSTATAIMAGTLDGETGLKTDREIFVAFKGDYYDLNPSIAHFDEAD